MRNNQPVTQQEYPVTDDHFLISRTDLKGRITYANPAFIEVSGYSRDELIGAHHNLVRHPDMPPAAFANFWSTLQDGRTWKGLVKNRRKNGDFYWVEASVSPLVDAGEVVGYASVRVKPARADVERAAIAYAELNGGKRRPRFRLHQGRLRRRGLIAGLRRLNVTSLRARLVSIVALAGVLLLASGGLGLYGEQQAGQRLQMLYHDGLQDVARLQRLDQGVTQSYQTLVGKERMALMNDREGLAATLGTSADQLTALWAEYRQREVNHTPLADEFDAALGTFIGEGLRGAVDILSGEDSYEVFVSLPNHIDAMEAQGGALAGQINQLIEAKQQGAEALAVEAVGAQQQMLIALAIVLGLGLALLMVIGALTLRAMLKPLREVEGFSLQIASGNLAAPEPKARRDELGRVIEALNVMRKSLGSIIHDVDDGIRVVTPAARDIAKGNEDLSSRTEQQAASLQQTASSMEEMTTTVAHNSDNARQASGLAADNAERTQATGELMQRLVTTMGEITDGSRKMAEIIDVIDSIAFQTNILALNASVEAARAGEQGRGFAVVAGEVRNLAGRSAEAAGQIRELIDSANRRVGGGADLVRQAEASIGEVMAASTRVNDIMGEITSASDEQSNGIGEINLAIAEMDQVTQQNASRVQSSAQAASRLESEAERLAFAIRAFRLKGAGRERVGAPDEAGERHGATTDQGADTSDAATRRTEGGARQQRSRTNDHRNIEEWEAF
ncbi:methyl-accepting chemotaxis protein [Halomonas sp. V046]|uniref:methyl-accepting chemotaxis protein n=1 Tax=Halomonas sp. V046 TaxID=3459611 RepID=UPI0040444379